MLNVRLVIAKEGIRESRCFKGLTEAAWMRWEVLNLEFRKQYLTAEQIWMRGGNVVKENMERFQCDSCCQIKTPRSCMKRGGKYYCAVWNQPFFKQVLWVHLMFLTITDLSLGMKRMLLNAAGSHLSVRSLGKGINIDWGYIWIHDWGERWSREQLSLSPSNFNMNTLAGSSWKKAIERMIND